MNRAVDKAVGMVPPQPLRENLRGQWMLRPDITFLNHGSFGAVPRVVFEQQEQWRWKVEAEPIELLGRQNRQLLDRAKAGIGAFLGMDVENFGLVTNATEGINAALLSLALRPGDELLTTTHVYNAVRQTMRHIAGRQGAEYREVEVTTPIQSAGQIVDKVLAAVGPRTRVLVIDHVTSPTAIVFPVEPIIEACAQRGVDVLVDGAHAPGMLDLTVPAVGAAWYAGNLHKWPCAPKGAAFIHVRPDRKSTLHPCVISHDWGKGVATEFAWQGTRDITAWLTAPAGIEFMAGLGWEEIRWHNHAMAVWAHRMLCERWHVTPLSPLDGELLGSMATVRLPDRLQGLSEADGQALQRRLYDEDHLEVPVIPWQNQWHIRVSCQVYNRPAEYHRLADVVARRAQIG